MPAVLGSYAPGAGFSFPRSFIYQVDIGLYGNTLTHAANVFTIHAPPPNPTVATIVFWPDWYQWSSNTYQLNQIVTDFYYQVPPSPTLTPLPFLLGYWLNPTTKKTGLYFNWFSGARLPVIANLPEQPFDYWLPRQLP